MTDPTDLQRPGEPVVDPPWEPPIAGTEIEHLSAALDRLRTTFRWKAGSLDADGLAAQVGASSLTLGALLKHLAFVEDYYFSTKLRGESPGPPWETVAWDAHPDWPFTSAGEDTPEELYALWDGAVERSRTRFAAVLDEGGLDQLVEETWPDGSRASLRRAVFDLVEEYGRHTGHADLIRESIDGLVGEDPPADWRPEPETPNPEEHPNGQYPFVPPHSGSNGWRPGFRRPAAVGRPHRARARPLRRADL